MNPLDSPPATTFLTPPVQKGLVLLVLLLLAVLAGVALMSLLQIVQVWFQPHYVPIARTVLAVALGAGCLLVLRMLLRRSPA